MPVFLIDEHQGVRPYEIGTVASIEQAAPRTAPWCGESTSTGSSAAAGPRSTSGGWRACSACVPAARSPGQATTTFQLLLARSPEQMEDELRGKIERGVRGADHGRILLAVEQAPA